MKQADTSGLTGYRAFGSIADSWSGEALVADQLSHPTAAPGLWCFPAVSDGMQRACRICAGCEGIAAINTIRSVMGVNLDTLRPEPCVEGYSTPGGYSYRAVKPIALERVMSISTALQQRGFREQGVSLSGIGGVETGGDAAEFILLGADTVQVSIGQHAACGLRVG